MYRLLRLGFLAGAISVLPLCATSITVGANNDYNSFPFGGHPPGFLGTRYQEAYASSLFSGPMSITGLHFFSAPGGTLNSGTYQLSFSTITAGVNSLSMTDLDANRGADNTLFTTVSLSGAAPANLTFTGTPFAYNPANGNLLLDIQITNPGFGNGLSVYQDGGPAGPSTIARYHNFGSGSTGYGLVTQFDFTDPANGVPEPCTFALLGCGLAALAAWRSRRSV